MTPARLYLRCLRWGLSTGLVAGAVTGAAVGFFAGDDVLDGLTADRSGLALVGTLFGVELGLLFAVVPTVFGGLALVVLLKYRHPRPASPEAVRRDLTVFLAGVVVLFDALVLLKMVVDDDDIVDALPYLLVATVCVVLMLWRARSSIAEGWTDG